MGDPQTAGGYRTGQWSAFTFIQAISIQLLLSLKPCLLYLGLSSQSLQSAGRAAWWFPHHSAHVPAHHLNPAPALPLHGVLTFSCDAWVLLPCRGCPGRLLPGHVLLFKISRTCSLVRKRAPEKDSTRGEPWESEVGIPELSVGIPETSHPNHRMILSPASYIHSMRSFPFWCHCYYLQLQKYKWAHSLNISGSGQPQA